MDLTLAQTVTCRNAPAAQVAAEVLDACRCGDVEAFRQLFESYKTRVYSIALHFTADASAAHDITQQVFVTLYTALPGFRNESRFDTWLYRIVVNACLHEHRRRRRFVPIEQAGEPRPARGQRSLEGDYIRREEIHAVRHAIAGLSPKLRLPLVLKHLEGLSYEEIAAALGCSPGTVASRLNRGRASLARTLAHLRPPQNAC